MITLPSSKMLISFLLTYSTIITLVHFEEVIVNIKTNPIFYSVITLIFFVAIYYLNEQRKQIDEIGTKLDQISDSMDASIKLLKESNQDFYEEFEKYK